MDVTHLLERYPGYVPIILESKDYILDKTRFLCHETYTVSDLLFRIRSYCPGLRMRTNEALFVLVKNVMPRSSASLSEVYKEHFRHGEPLEMFLCKENVFGGFLTSDLSI